ncbi:MAG: M23 family metallopeptidase [Bacteroidales bacterium]
MKRLKNIKQIWGGIKNNWKTKYRLMITDESTHKEHFSLRLSPKNIFVVVVTSSVCLIILTAMLIAFTPLRVYVPGYTTPEEYRLYKKMSERVDSVDLLLKQNQQYIDNFYSILSDKIVEKEDMTDESQQTPQLSPTEREADNIALDGQIREEADMILGRITQESGELSAKPVVERANIMAVSLYPPAIGTLINEFNITQNHYGIDIKNERNTLITAVAEGMVIFAGFDPNEGNVMIIQHPGNVLSIYKHNELLLKKVGAKVTTGEPIAKMGNSGFSEHKNVHLHFELWYNGFPINPLDYLVVK